MILICKILIVMLVVAAIAVDKRRVPALSLMTWSLCHAILIGLAALNIGFMVYLWANHISFPLNLDLMEGTVLEHFRRALHGLPVYPAPAPDYVPFAYNPLYYFFCIPFAWVLGDGLATLRFVSILGMATIGTVIFLVVKRAAASAWWGFVALGLFAAAYMAMDAYLDSAHSDSWMIAAAMLGTLLLDGNKSMARNVAGLLLLVASFWFKQHGAVLVAGGLLFVLMHNRWKTSIVYVLVVIVSGPALYLLAGQQLFGSHFHYFTWSVPSQWSVVTLKTFLRYFGLIGISYFFLAVPACWSYVRQVRYGIKTLDVWRFQLPFAMLAGWMGALDWGSSNNVFIPQEVWFILAGTLALREVGKHYPWVGPAMGIQLSLGCAFAFFLYDPATVIVSSRADAAFEELVTELKNLPGQVYAPSVGQLERGYTLSPTAHWVALEDMARVHGTVVRDQPSTRTLLAPLLTPGSRHFILANDLGFNGFMDFLGDYFVVEKDYGDRFKPLRVLPKRWDHGWPRYLYRQKERPM